MIRFRAVRMSPRHALLVIFLLAGLSGPVLAGPGEPLGADSVGQRVRDRARMQAEYEVIRKERRLALAEVRERVAPAFSGGDEYARGGSKGNPGSATQDSASDSAAAGRGTGYRFRFYIACAVLLMLGSALYLRVRRLKAG